MEPNAGILAVLATAAKSQITAHGITQALIVAAVTSAATGYVNAQVLQKEVGFIRENLDRLDREQREIRAHLDTVRMKQATAIAERVENQKTQQDAIDELKRRVK